MIEVDNTEFKEGLTKWFVKDVTKDEFATIRIMAFLYPKNPKYKFFNCTFGHFYSTKLDKCPYCSSEKLVENKTHVLEQYKSDKHKELIESLDYLKSKSHKTKQDKESIYTLETILKNFS